jgi:DNA-binding transcriptional LysR family regulator
MKKAISAHKKSRGRPATGQDKSVATRFPGETLRQIEAWSSAQPQEVSRSEAIRRLVELGLGISTPTKLVSKASNKTRAAELAAKVVDKMIDPTAPADERDRRRRRLTKGPQEFREDRVDLPKAKGK